MGHYRFYLLDSDSRSIEERERRCANDLTALELARSLCRDGPVQVWVDSRLVAHLDSAAAAQSATANVSPKL